MAHHCPTGDVPSTPWRGEALPRPPCRWCDNPHPSIIARRIFARPGLCDPRHSHSTRHTGHRRRVGMPARPGLRVRHRLTPTGQAHAPPTGCRNRPHWGCTTSPRRGEALPRPPCRWRSHPSRAPLAERQDERRDETALSRHRTATAIPLWGPYQASLAVRAPTNDGHLRPVRVDLSRVPVLSSTHR